ncbi:MAG: 7TM-DISM domain-containing protein, partial [Comamonadaceae bacterium]
MKFSSLLTAAQACLRTILLLLALGLPIAAQAQPIAVHDLAVLVDADGSETITSVSAAAQRFTPLDGLLSAGYTRKVHWLRFSVQAPAAGSWWLEVMPPFLDDLRLFEPSGSGFAERRAGDRLPFASREENYRGFIFRLALADSAPHTYYLRLQTTSSSLLTLQLWQAEQFRAAQDLENVLMGLLFGFFLLVLLLNLLLWWGTRESLYGWFSLYVGATVLLYFAFTGLAAQHLLPQAPLIADASMGACLLFFLAASVPLFRRMLHVERDQKLFFAVFRVLVALPCLLMVSLFTGHYPEAGRIAMGVSGAGGLMMLYLAVRLWRSGRRESRYLMVAMALGLLASVGGALFMLGLIPGSLFLNMMQWQRWIPLLVTLTLQVALAVRLHESNEIKREEAKLTALAEREAQHELRVHQIELEAQNEELRRTQKELDTSNARHFDFYDVSPVGYCTVSEKGLIKEVNLTTSTLFNVPRSQLIKQPIGNFILNDDQGIYYQLRRKLRDTDKPLSCELRLLRQGGTPFWVHLDAIAAKDEEGAPVLRLVLSNVSSQKRLEQERDQLRADVKDHEARWTIAAEAIGEGFWEFDVSSGEMLRSRVFDAVLGYGEQDLPLTADAWVALIHPDDLARNTACLQNYMTGKSATYAIEMRLRTKDGNYRWIACRGTGIARDAAGAPTRMMGMHTDISARKQAELDLVQSLAEKNAALERMQHAERFAQGTVDAMSASLATLDANGVILSVNQAWRQIAQTVGGGSDNLCEGANYLGVCDAASGAYSEGAHEMAAGIRAVIQSRQNEFMLEYPCHSPTERRWFSSYVTRFKGASAIRVVVTHEDISARKRADLAREEALTLLKKIADLVPGMVYQYHLRLDGSSYF